MSNANQIAFEKHFNANWSMHKDHEGRYLARGLDDMWEAYQLGIEHSRVDVEALRGELADLQSTLSNQENELDKLREEKRVLVEAAVDMDKAFMSGKGQAEAYQVFCEALALESGEVG